MFQKMLFILTAAGKSKEMPETEWKEWVLKEGIKFGFTVEELTEALLTKK